jgi:hypothetical protein
LIVRELEEDLGIPQTIVSEILMAYLGKKGVAAKCVPGLLTQEHNGILYWSYTGHA